MTAPSLARRLGAEAIGTALLLAAVVGSGIMGERLAGGNEAVALLANTLATGAALIALILTFAPVSGAQFNPVVTLALAWDGTMRRREAPAYVAAQLAGALLGVAVAHLMFGEPLFAASQKMREGWPQMLGEFVATFGLVSVILGGSRHNRAALPYAVGAYIAAAYWFTSSTSFANPAVTVTRALTNTFAGVRPADAPGFIVAEILGGIAALFLSRWLFQAPRGGSAAPTDGA
ncbi:MAG: aquaporin family protein [Proteobacteria bacterium]|nr:aquaporin family protein [Pseudomonadota bacterium]